jgi:hypothetical protein
MCKYTHLHRSRPEDDENGTSGDGDEPLAVRQQRRHLQIPIVDLDDEISPED